MRLDLSVIIASVFYAGYIPFAPGTFGTIISFATFFIFKPDGLSLFLMICLIFFLGIYVAGEAEKRLNERDSRHIVIDEFVGYPVSIYGHTTELLNLLIAFFLFRFFDILKPFPIRLIERKLKGGFSIMLDDVIAGVYANISLYLIMALRRII